MRRRRWIVFAAAWLAALVLVEAAGDVKVTTVVADDGRVLASFTAYSAWTSEAREIVRSGLALTFSFDVELRRPSTIWFDSTLAHVRVASSVKYDNLTGTYQMSKLREGRVVSTDNATQEAPVREWMTFFDRVPLEPGRLEPNAEYYVRVRLFCSPRRTVSLWSMWPFGKDDGSGRADFTVIK
jgi:Domain of unknown function (DUF4390)